MSGTSKSCSKGIIMSPSETPPLPLHLDLDPIKLGNQKSSWTGELKRVLRVPLGSTMEGHPFGGDRDRPAPSVASDDLKHFKESVQDSSKKAGNRAKMFSQSISKLDKFAENLSSKKRQRSHVLSSERSGVNWEKMGNRLHGSARDLWNQRMEEKPKNAVLVKRFRTSMVDGQADNKLTAVTRQPITKEKREEKIPVGNAVSIRTEEKICRIPAGGDGWEKKIKRKRSVSAVGGRVISGDIDPKQAMDSRTSGVSKLDSSDGPGFRSKSSSGVGGVAKLNHRFESPSPNGSMVVRNDQETASSPRDRMDMLGQRVLLKGNKSNSREGEQSSCSPGLLNRGRVSRALRNGSMMVLDSSTNLESSRGASQVPVQSRDTKKIIAADVDIERIQSTSQPMADWAGPRPPKKSRLRRPNPLSPVTDHSEIQNSPQGFAMSEFGRRSLEISSNASLQRGASNVNTLKISKDLQQVASSAAAVSECEEPGALDNEPNDKAVNGSGVTMAVSRDAGSSVLSAKNKLLTCEIGDGVRRQGRTGRDLLTRAGSPSVREKSDDLAPKPPQSARAGSERNKRKSGRPAMKKLKDRKCLPRVGSVPDSSTPELMGEWDDHETLVAAANSTRNALSQACSSRFWKKMEPIFAFITNDDASFLKKQFHLAEELEESLSFILGVDCNTSDVCKDKDDKREGNFFVQGAPNVGPLRDKFDTRRLYKFPSVYDRVASALIDDESEEFYHQAEGKNLSPHTSDDSHCGSCNQMDIDSRDRDRVESEVESAVEQNQKLCLLDKVSCNKGSASSTFRNSGISTSGYSNEYSFGDDDYSHLEMGLVSEICSTDIGKLQQKELSVLGLRFSDEQYQLMPLNDKLMLELQSIDLYPETLPDLAEEGEQITDDITEMKAKLHQKVTIIRKMLQELDEALVSGQDMDRRRLEEMAMSKIVEMANKRRMACRATNTTKASVRRVPNQIAGAFTKRTLARFNKYEETGISSFSEPDLQEILFSRPAGKSDAKSVDCVGSGTASNVLNEALKHQAEAKGSGAISSTPEVLNSRGENTVSSGQDSDMPGSSKVTSAFDIKSTAISERETNTKTKKRLNHSRRRPGFPESPETASVPVNGNSTQPIEAAAATDLPTRSNKEREGEAVDLVNLALDGNHDQDLGSLLNFDVDGLQDCFTAGLEEPPWDDFTSVMIL